jgi:tRNA-splicing ligase RtcB
MAFREYSDERGAPIKAWVEGVPFDAAALQQVRHVARLPFVRHHVAVMPDAHVDIGATVGTVIATRHAVVPAAVGVDIGCGMAAVQTSLHANDLPESLRSCVPTSKLQSRSGLPTTAIRRVTRTQCARCTRSSRACDVC